MGLVDALHLFLPFNFLPSSAYVTRVLYPPPLTQSFTLTFTLEVERKPYLNFLVSQVSIGLDCTSMTKIIRGKEEEETGKSILRRVSFVSHCTICR